MCPAEIWVILDNNVTRLQVAPPFENRTSGKLHHTEEYRKSKLALGDHFPVLSTVDSIRTIERFGNYRRKRRFLMDKIHL